MGGSGPTNAEILIVGEAPGGEEVSRGIPFVGPSGRLLRKKLEAAGINPNSVRFENVCERKIENSKELFLDGEEIPTQEMKSWMDDLKVRIQSLSPKVIVACGNTAMFAVAGKTSINDHHCTVIYREAENLPPVVPVFHPAYVLRAEQMGGKRGSIDGTTRMREASAWLVFGLAKAKEVAAGKVSPRRTYILKPSLESIKDYTNQFTLGIDPLSIDIEVFQNEITCIAFAHDATFAMCIPLSIAGGSYWPPDEEREVWKRIAMICCSNRPKVFQNFIFDTMFLSRFGIEVGGEIHDTMLAAGLLHPELSKGLDDLGRLYTFTPAWKGSRDWSASVNPEELWRYNATDAAITREIFDRQMEELDGEGIKSLYTRHVVALAPRVFEICNRGWNIDRTSLQNVRGDMQKRIEELTKRITDATSQDFNPRSHHQIKAKLKEFGYVIPTKDGAETTDRRSLLKLLKKHPEDRLIPTLLEFSKAQKLMSTYGNVALDPDGRMRFSVNIAGTKSGRFSSSQTPWGTGLNSQNIPSRDPESPYNFRHLVLPDDDHNLIQVDLKQAEARVVAWLSREEAMERIFTTGGDIHTETANRIFGENIRKLPEAERKRKRYLGKKSVHSFNYGMQAQTFVDSCLDEADLVITLEEAESIRDGFFRGFSRIPLWHREIQMELKRSRSLKTTYGRMRSFHGTLNEDIYREAYSFMPQAYVADTINESWIRLYENGLEALGAYVIQQGHDSLVISTPKEKTNTVIFALKNAFDSVSFKIHGIDRKIPYDIAVGPNWRDLKEVK